MTTEGGLKHDVNTRISEDDRRRLWEAAEREDRKPSAIVRRALREYLDRIESERS